MATSVDIIEDDTALFCGIETTEQTAVTIAATNALYVKSVKFTKKEDVIQQDRRSRANPLARVNKAKTAYWEIEAVVPASSSGTAGTAGACAPILLASGAKQVLAAGVSATYTRDTRPGFDAMTAALRTTYSDDTFDLQHLATGVRGTLDFKAEIGGELEFTLKGVGKYAHPARVAKLAPNFGTQLTNLFDIISVSSLSAVTLNSKSMCVQSVAGTNFFGWEPKWLMTGCTLAARAEPMNPGSNGQIKLLIKQTDWNDAANSFNPYVVGDRASVSEIPFLLTLGTTAGRIWEFSATVQAHSPEPAALPNGTVGMNLTLDITANPQIVEK